MNERIFELAEQAEEYATTRHPVSNIALSVNSEKFVKKFADLIVQECAMLCRQEGENKFNNVWEQVRAKCDAQMILEHFGVEE